MLKFIEPQFVQAQGQTERIVLFQHINLKRKAGKRKYVFPLKIWPKKIV